MHIVDVDTTDTVIKVPQGTTPNYNSHNPLLKLMDIIESRAGMAEREYYVEDSLQWLFPINRLELYGPSGDQADNLNPRTQDSKTDFQKQNVRSFAVADTTLVRGLVRVGGQSFPFLRVSYRGDTDSRLSEATGHNLGEQVRLWIRVGNAATPAPIRVPFNGQTQLFEVELWGYPGPDLATRLAPDAKAARAQVMGHIIARPDLVKGEGADFTADAIGGKVVADVAPDHTLHPIRPLHVELAWATDDTSVWDSQDGSNYHYEFNMIVRGLDNYIARGWSENPHGGVGLLEYRNLLSNYGRFAGSRELGRTLEAWNFNAFGQRGPEGAREDFFAVDYMDLHVVKPHCGIGLHRHRDNSEVFLMLDDHAYMFLGDWCKMPQRERCIEVRKLKAGSFAMLKGGNLHGLLNPVDWPLRLFMFGGYD